MASCQGCGSEGLEQVLWLGYQPLAEHLLPIGSPQRPEFWPLELVECQACSLVQLASAPPPVQIFPLDHPYASGNTAALRQHFGQLANSISSQHVDAGDLVVDIGSNDGTLLAAVASKVRRVGVEPTNQALAARDKGITVYQNFFSAKLAHRISREWGKARVITATNVLAHVADIHDVLEGIRILLRKDGVLVAENGDLQGLVSGLQFDSVYAEHRYYYSLSTFSELLRQHGLFVFKAERIPVHGGLFRVWASKTNAAADFVFENASVETAGLADRVARWRADFRQVLAQARYASSGGVSRIWGIGAATRASTLINYVGIDQELVEAVVEVSGSAKIDRWMPGTRIPVLDEARLFAEQPEFALIFAWQIAEFLMSKLRQRGFQGKFILPLPQARILA